jgi:hypothetical protein
MSTAEPFRSTLGSAGRMLRARQPCDARFDGELDGRSFRWGRRVVGDGRLGDRRTARLCATRRRLTPPCHYHDRGAVSAGRRLAHPRAGRQRAGARGHRSVHGVEAGRLARSSTTSWRRVPGGPACAHGALVASGRLGRGGCARVVAAGNMALWLLARPPGQPGERYVGEICGVEAVLLFSCALMLTTLFCNRARVRRPRPRGGVASPRRRGGAGVAGPALGADHLGPDPFETGVGHGLGDVALLGLISLSLWALAPRL